MTGLVEPSRASSGDADEETTAEGRKLTSVFGVNSA